MSTETETKPATIADLHKFCGDCGRKYDMSKPFVLGGYCWGVSNIICARIPLDGFNSVPRPDGKPFPNVLLPWEQFKPDRTFDSLPKIKVEWDSCWACGGSGTLECNTCDDEDDCPCCLGLCEVYWPRTAKIGAARVDVRYFDLIQKMPDPRIVIPVEGEEGSGISFRFCGGEGLLMPLLPTKPGDGDS
jgi:hypothetical protein